MTEQPHRRPLPPTPVLPPPQTPGGHYGSPQRPLPAWPGQEPPHYASNVPAPPTSGPGATYSFQDYHPAAQAGHWQVQQWQGREPPAWGYGGWPPPPPPRRSSVVGRVLLGLVGAAAVVFLGLILLAAAFGVDHAAERAGDVDHSPARPADPDSSAPANPRGANAVLAANSLYGQGGLANGDCPAEPLGEASTQEQTRFYESLMSCLTAEWGPPVTQAGYTFSEPGLVVFDAPVATPCGNAAPKDGSTLAFYCPSDAVMYADVPQMREFFGDIDVAYAVLIGHEFGHHVQSEVGVLDAYDEAVYEDYGERLVLSRRVELQASCMGGLFLGAVAESFPVDDRRLGQLDRVAGAFGDELDAPANQRDHGTGRSNRDWILRAFNNNDIAECNTFTAPLSAVE